MGRSLGRSKSIFYFDVCGQVNTEKTLELAVQRAHELGTKKLVVASETGLSALKAVEALRNTGIELVVVTSAAGTEVENTIIGDLQIGIPDKAIWTKLEKSGAQIVRATDPFYNIGAELEQQGTPTLATLARARSLLLQPSSLGNRRREHSSICRSKKCICILASLVSRSPRQFAFSFGSFLLFRHVVK